MSLALSLSTAQAQAVVIASLCDGGTMEVYAGEQPTTPEDAPGSAPLVTFLLPAPFAFSVIDGVITSRAIPGAMVEVDGDATWFRIYRADATTPVFDADVGLLGSDAVLQLASTSLTVGQTLVIDSFIYAIPGV